MSTEAIGAATAKATTTTASIDCTSIVEKLMQKDRDLEIAAKIGQSLLEQNRDLQQRTEFLEESLAKSSEEMVQMKHELDRKAELLRVYCRYDDDGFTREIITSDDSLKKRLEKTKLENIQLKQDVSSMRREMEAQIERDRRRYEDVSRQFELAQQQIISLHAQVVERGEDYSAQSVLVEKLLREISMKCHRERELTAENADLTRQVDEALLRQNELSQQMKELQDRYAELSCMFCDAEEELCRFRSAPPMRSGSVDSLYDSLASELENSDSGFSTTPAATARAGQMLSLRLELQRAADEIEVTSSPSKEEIDVPSNVLAEVARKRITIEPVAPPQTPLSESAATPLAAVPDTSRRLGLARRLTCDVATSCSELAGPSIASPPATSTPEKPPTEGILQLSEPRSTCCTPLVPFMRSSSAFYPSRFRGSLRLPMRPSQQFSSALHRCASDDSLEDYVAPKMGEPGVPGTRDLNMSLRMLRARRKVKKCSTSKDEWTDYSVILGQDHQRTVKAYTGSASVGLGTLQSTEQAQSGVLFRAELNSPLSSPHRGVSLASSTGGLRSLTSLGDASPSRGIVVRRF